MPHVRTIPPRPLSPPATPGSEKHFFTTVATPATPASRLGRYLGKSLQLQTILGTGAYGVVYEAYDHLSHTRYAVKALSKTNPDGSPLDQRQKDFQQREIQLHYAASAHPNVVSMLRIVDDPDCTYVILEHCPEGDLFSNITEKGRYESNEDLVRDVFLQILDAVQHCHRLGIYHRDLKPENILVSAGGARVLLADFGLATMENISDDHGCGSTFYMSEECLDQSARNLPYICAPNDVWSLGVILVNLTCGRNPWKAASSEDSTYRAYLKDRHFLKSILPLTDDFNDLLGMIFERDPEKRITLPQLRRQILQLHRFCVPPPPPAMALPTPPLTPCHSIHARPNHAMEDVIIVSSDAYVGDNHSYDNQSLDYSSSDSDVSDESDSDFDSGYESPVESVGRIPIPDRVVPKLQYVLPRPNPPTNLWRKDQQQQYHQHHHQPVTCATAYNNNSPWYDGYQSQYHHQAFTYGYGMYHGFHATSFPFSGHCY